MIIGDSSDNDDDDDDNEQRLTLPACNASAQTLSWTCRPK